MSKAEKASSSLKCILSRLPRGAAKRIAQKANIDNSTISLIKNGTRKTISDSIVDKLATVFGMTSSEFLRLGEAHRFQNDIAQQHLLSMVHLCEGLDVDKAQYDVYIRHGQENISEKIGHGWVVRSENQLDAIEISLLMPAPAGSKLKLIKR